MKKRLLCFAASVLAALTLAPSAAAYEYGYTYTGRAEVMELPAPYETETVIGTKAQLIAPADIHAYNGEIYILDSERRDITVLDNNYNIRSRVKFVKNGADYAAEKLSSFYIYKDTIYAADYSGKIFTADLNGNVKKECVLGEEELGTTAFRPQCITVAQTGYVYVLSENEYRGIIVLDNDLSFDSFFGALDVDVTAGLLLDMVWRNFMTDKQIDNSVQYVPGGYTDIALDKNGFVYAARGVSESAQELIRKLNPAGKNVLRYTGEFGDMSLGNSSPTAFISVTVDDDGFITALDKTRQRLFEYSPDGELMFVFSGAGIKDGYFSNAVCLESIGDRLLVLDKDTASLTVFRPTDFGKDVRSAVTLYRKAQFRESEELWNGILKQSGNYEYAYTGLGKIAEMSGDYAKAMEYYRLGDSRVNYSSAMKKQRSAAIKKSFPIVMTAVIIAAAAFLIYAKRKAKNPKKERTALCDRGKISYIFYTLLHPGDGFSDLRYNKKHSLAAANIIVFLWFFVSCLNFNYNGYIFNENNINDFNVFVILLSTVGVIFLFTLSNVLLASFFEGKGTFREIWITLAYSLIPYTAWLAAELMLSNILIAEEGAFITAFRVFAAAWTLFLCFTALLEVHQYSFGVTLASSALSIVGVLIVVFLVFLMFNLSAQIIDFVSTVFKELNYRRIAG